MTCTSDGFMFVGMDSGSIKVLSCRRGGTRETIVHGNVKRILFGIAFGHQTSCGNDHVLQMWLLLLFYYIALIAFLTCLTYLVHFRALS